MSRICEICGKRPQAGNKISHAHNKSKRRWLPNIQRVSVMINGVKRNIRACTRCIRGNKVVKAL